jgi:hypothetical protein
VYGWLIYGCLGNRPLKHHSPQFEKAFEWMLERQAEPYRRYSRWLREEQNIGHNQHGEVIRAAMLQARRTPIVDLDIFEQGIHENHDRLVVRK